MIIKKGDCDPDQCRTTTYICMCVMIKLRSFGFLYNHEKLDWFFFKKNKKDLAVKPYPIVAFIIHC